MHFVYLREKNNQKCCREVEREKGLKGTEIYSIENKKGNNNNERTKTRSETRQVW
jgi:hypothetical protein